MVEGQKETTSHARAWTIRAAALVVGAILVSAGTSSTGGAVKSSARASHAPAQLTSIHSVAPVAPVAPAATPSGFAYGFDLSTEGPYNEWPSSDQTATQTMRTFAGSFVDIPIMGWGVNVPEPAPGVYDFSNIAARIALVQSTGGVPIITLSAAPDWMKGGVPYVTNWNNLNVAPLPQHYADYATLCAAVAAAFPQVKYFVVWKEMQGFWDTTTNQYDAAGYTTMYNDTYNAIKAVRPDALVGGPYVSMHSKSTASAKSTMPRGAWGVLSQADANVITYWLANKVGADFLAVDGRSYTNDVGLITDPVTSTAKYAAVDAWLQTQTTLPIAWMESHILPDPTQWTDQQQAAVRVAALVEMQSSGAAAGMQWQPQQQTGWDEGLWTTTLLLGGGLPTYLGTVLPQVLHVLSSPVTIVPGQPAGTLVATGALGTISVNLNGGATTVVVTP